MKKLISLFIVITLCASPASAQLPGLQIYPLLNVRTAATITLTDSAVDPSDNTTYTFTSKNIGPASSDRYIIVGAGNTNGSSTTITSLTVNGNAATQVVTLEGSGGGGVARASLYIYGPLTTGTTATIVVNYSGLIGRAAIGVWAATGLNSTTATATATSSSDPLNASINVSSNGFLVGYSIVYTAGGVSTYTWTNLTETFDTTVEASVPTTHSGANNNFASAQTGLSVTADPSVAITAGSLVLAAFR